MADSPKKRKDGRDHNRSGNKRSRGDKKKHQFRNSSSGLEPGTSGVFVTCQRGHEFQCVGELYSLFDEFYQRLWPDAADDLSADEEDSGDIESSILSEISSLKSKKEKKPFYSIKMAQECVTFMVTRPPIDPVKLVEAICLETLAGNKRTRWAQRFTPIQSTSYANLPDICSMAEKVLSPMFLSENAPPVKELMKYAIRPNARDNNVLSRDSVIQVIGSVIGRGHPVDLKGYDVMILVETVRNITGMSIVRDFDKLKRFNLETLYADYQASQKPVKSIKNTPNEKEDTSEKIDQNAEKDGEEEKTREKK